MRTRWTLTKLHQPAWDSDRSAAATPRTARLKEEEEEAIELQSFAGLCDNRAALQQGFPLVWDPHL